MTSARVYRRRRFVAALLALGLLTGLVSAGSFTVNALAAPLPVPIAQLSEPAAQAGEPGSFALPEVGRMAVGVEGFDGPLLYSGDQGAAPIASITKVVTALLVLEAKPLAAGEAGPDIRYGAADVARYQQILAEGGSVAPVSDGLVLSQRQSLEALLLPSANNYAYSLAEWAYGSVDAFVAAANDWLAGQGLGSTRIVEPSGLSPLNVSSPADLVRLGRIALAQPALAEIVRQSEVTLPGIGLESNTNKLLGKWGVNGIKTGTTDEAGACLLFSSTIDVDGEAISIVGVVLGGDSHSQINAAIGALLESMDAALRRVELVAAGEVVGTVETAWGQRSELVATESLTVLSFSDSPIQLSSSLAPSVTAAAGSTIGTLSATSGSRTVEVPLTLKSEIADPGPLWRLANPNRSAAGLG